MAAAAGLFNHSTATAQPLAVSRVTPMANATSTTSSTSSSDASSAGISANDFLTLLVTEMKNQDPTANTDPNQYINQLVNVNSLEQLININQTLSSALGPSTANTTGTTQAAKTIPIGAVTQASPAASSANTQPATQTTSSGLGATGDTAMQTLVNRFAPGNLSVPDSKPAAQNLAHALDGHSRMQSVGTLPAAR
ncbi:MAG TPA: flagellar hook capping FlgD N-terminal domain-containing protein [Terracidiphilus sp.]|nr:flagellar hook capping FlgD N-terminal domain-containing protein [Terracidiphilus sp.]